MNVWILSFNDVGDGAPYTPHQYSHKHGVVFADRRSAEKQMDVLAAELFGTAWRTVQTKDDRVVVEGFIESFGGGSDNGWVMIELHGVQSTPEL